MRLLLILAILTPAVTAAYPIPVDLCRILRDPVKFAGKLISVNGFVNSAMHGTYLRQAGCDESVLLVLPGEIPNYNGGITVLKNDQFEHFLDARYNHQLDAPVFSAKFVVQVEYSKHGQSFGYYRRQRTRVILQSIESGHTTP